jgi:large-conductance mechanosensitive channel
MKVEVVATTLTGSGAEAVSFAVASVVGAASSEVVLSVVASYIARLVQSFSSATELYILPQVLALQPRP